MGKVNRNEAGKKIWVRKGVVSLDRPDAVTFPLSEGCQDNAEKELKAKKTYRTKPPEIVSTMETCFRIDAR
jgi:hypothetical protein